MHIIRLGLATLLLGALAGSAQAQSFGRFNLPSTFSQYLGCGNGAGHHVPIARVPGTKPLYVRRVVVLPRAQRVPEHCKYPPQMYPCSSCAMGSCTGYGYSAPPMGAEVYHQPVQPAGGPNPPARSILKPAEQIPAGKPSEGSSLRSPPMPAADPQAFYGYGF